MENTQTITEQGQVSALATEPKDEGSKISLAEYQSKQEGNHPNTGISALDRYFESLSLGTKAAVYGTLKLAVSFNETGDKILDYLRKEMSVFDDLEEMGKQAFETGQILTDSIWFLGFVEGAEIGLQDA